MKNHKIYFTLKNQTFIKIKRAKYHKIQNTRKIIKLIHIRRIYDKLFLVDVSDDCVQGVQHDVGVVRCEGEGGSDPDGGLSTPWTMKVR